MFFEASLGKTAKLLTILVFVILVSVVSFPLFMTDENVWIKSGILLMVFATIAISWGYSTNGYEITQYDLIIKRPLGAKVYSRNLIRSVQKIDAQDLRFSLRTFGNGGFWGYYGKYYNQRFGSMTWYATDLKNSVLITTNDNKKIVVTPDEPYKFMDTLSARY